MSENKRITKSIRVLLVDDSPLALSILARILETDPEIEVVGTAFDGIEGLEAIRKLNPDVLCTDYHMPRMDGLELVKQVMKEHPIPILVVSVSVQEDDTRNIFNLVQAGAVDVMPKPESGFIVDSPESVQLRRKVKLISGVLVIRRFFSSQTLMRGSQQSSLPSVVGLPNKKKGLNCANQHCIVAIGGSTGAPQGFAEILWNLPVGFNAPIVCVQHTSPGFSQSLVDWLDRRSSLKVKLAKDGEPVIRGNVYFAPDNTHLLLKNGFIRLSAEQRSVNGHIPSVDILFDSVAENYGNKAVSVLLSGMGKDGAEGTSSIYKAGGFTVAQDEATSIVYGMPAEAVRLNAVTETLPVQKIALRLIDLIQSKAVKV